MKIINKLRLIFDRDTKIKLFLLLAAIIIGALLETLALSLISPFISVLLDDSMIQSNQYIKWAYDLLNLSSIGLFLALLTFLLAGVYIFRGVYLYFVSKVQYRFIARRQAILSERLLEKILRYSYLFHSGKNIAELQRIIITDVQNMFQLIYSVLYLLTDFFMTLFIVLFLAITSPLMTLCIVAMAALCVVLYLKVFQQRMSVAGDHSRAAQINMNKAVNQAIGGIKEVKVLRRESHFHRVFTAWSDQFVTAYTQHASMNVIPKLVIETACFGGTFILIGVFIVGGMDISGIIPELSLFVLAAFRLLPAVSRLTSQYNNVIYYRPSIDAVYRSLFEENDLSSVESGAIAAAPVASLDIIVQGVTFQYPNTPAPVLENISLVIPDKKSVAFIGPSGAGKTTLADLILGILCPATGEIFYNGRSIHHSFDEWTGRVGYIPQQIYLLDESILENVAFGLDRSEIDEAKVWRALEQAQLISFVKTLPNGLETIVGDRGIRLSGGQRQRVGIARAIYEDPPILVMDEATSSLDDETERAVMDALMGFQGNKTMIIVAHRLSTIEHCNIVYRVEKMAVIQEKS